MLPQVIVFKYTSFYNHLYMVICINVVKIIVLSGELSEFFLDKDFIWYLKYTFCNL